MGGATNWTFRFENLLAQDSNSKAYSYILEEVVPPGYRVSYDGWTIINHYKPEIPEKPGEPEEKPEEPPVNLDKPKEDQPKKDQPQIYWPKEDLPKKLSKTKWEKAPQTGVDFPFLSYLLTSSLSGAGLVVLRNKTISENKQRKGEGLLAFPFFCKLVFFLSLAF